MNILETLAAALKGGAQGAERGFGMVQDMKRQSLDEREQQSRQKYYDTQAAQNADRIKIDQARDERDKAWQEFQIAQSQGATGQKIAELEMRLQGAQLRFQEAETRHATQLGNMSSAMNEMKGGQEGLGSLDEMTRMQVLGAYMDKDFDKLRKYKELYPRELEGLNIPAADMFPGATITPGGGFNMSPGIGLPGPEQKNTNPLSWQSTLGRLPGLLSTGMRKFGEAYRRPEILNTPQPEQDKQKELELLRMYGTGMY